MTLALKLLLAACLAAPAAAVALRCGGAARRAAWCAAALLLACLGARIDPLAAGVLRVDDAMRGGAVCSPGLRPLR